MSRLTLLLSCEGVAFVTRQIEERAPAVGLTRTFDFFAKLNKLKQVVRRRCFVTRLHSVANFCNKSQVTQFQNVWKTAL